MTARRRRPCARRRALRAAACGTLVLTCLAVAVAAHAAEPQVEQRFEAANAAFAAGRYAEAREAFTAILCEHGASPPLLFNLGNASFRAGRVGDAILAYERALLLAPRDPDVRANLRQARNAVGLEPPAAGTWLRLTHLLTVDAWAWLASAALYALCLALLALRLPRRRARGGLRRAARLAAACAALTLLVAASACYSRVRDVDRAVVLGSDPVLRVAPYASATASASADLEPGEIVRAEQQHAGFVLVRTLDGRSGWVAQRSVARIVGTTPPCAGTAPASGDATAKP